jgi:hypothetical protein
MSENAGPTAAKSPTGGKHTISCPFAGLNEESQVLRRRDLQDLGVTFTEALKPLKSVLSEMKGLNVRYASANRQLRHVTRFQLGITLVTLLSLASLVFMLINLWNALGVLEQQAVALGQLQKDVGEQANQLRQLKSTALETKKQVAEVKQEQDEKPQLELVPETDPVKARRAPVKLRVKAPVSPKAPPSMSVPTSSAGVSSKRAAPAVAEIPLSTDSF